MTWNDAAIAKDNPGVTLPSTKITIVHRSDGSGTTSNFTKYLAKAAPTTWKLTPGDTVTWPASQAGAKNTGVAQIIKQTPGAIGYVDLSDATATRPGVRLDQEPRRQPSWRPPSPGPPPRWPTRPWPTT